MAAIYDDLNEGQRALFRRRWFTLLTIANIFLAVFAASYALTAWRDFKTLVFDERKIQIPVNGEGKVSTKPDVARINATVVTYDDALATAQRVNTEKSNAVVAYFKGAGVAEKDIKTVFYNIFPQYNYQPCYVPGPSCPVVERPRIIGYEVRNSFEVTVRDLGKAGEILSGVVTAGANEVSGITFTIDDPTEVRAAARKEAIEDAEKKAKQLARDLGMRVGKIVSFSEGGYPGPIYAREAAYGKGGGGGPVPVEPGEQELMVNVSIVYEFW